jgi:aminoglycoside 6-adenylyltransferase
MRSEQTMLDLIVNTAREDERIRVVILNGSRANPRAARDPFQDFDIRYFVVDMAPFVNNPAWSQRFGETMVMQMPDAMQDPASSFDAGFAYLMQFTDGNRIDLGIYPLSKLDTHLSDSLSRVLLDKDGLVPPLAPASEKDYLPRPPSAKAFADCCNEFWWVCPYVAKGLWRQEFVYARHMLDQTVRAQLVRMLEWYIGVETHFTTNLGYHGKYFQRCLQPELWELLVQTYADGSYAQTWEALFAMCRLFRLAANRVGQDFGFAYPQQDDERVSAHLQHVRDLPQDAQEIY